MTRCIIPEFCAHYRIDFGMILKAKGYLLDLSSKEICVYTFIKIIIVFFGRKIEIVFLME